LREVTLSIARMKFVLAITLAMLIVAVYTICEQQSEIVRLKGYGGALGSAYVSQQSALFQCEKSRFLDTSGSYMSQSLH